MLELHAARKSRRIHYCLFFRIETVRARRTMRFTGLNRFVKACTHSLQLRGALTSTSSVFSCASFLSVRHSNVSHCIWFMVLAAPPVTKYARYLTAWWSITAVRGVQADVSVEERHDFGHIFSG